MKNGPAVGSSPLFGLFAALAAAVAALSLFLSEPFHSQGLEARHATAAPATARLEVAGPAPQSLADTARRDKD